MNVFSFCLYGSKKKYIQGMIENVNTIKEKFPDWYIFIYFNGIPSWAHTVLSSNTHVRMIPARFPDNRSMLERFYAIDVPGVNIMFVRDADSRIHQRDEWCIRQFIASDKQIHIIRDHPHHEWCILGGIWGLRNPIHFSMKEAIRAYIERHPNVWSIDMNFLRDIIYPMFSSNALIHSMIRMSPTETITEIPFPVINHDFCGQVMDYPDGSDVPRHMYLDR